MVHKTYQYHARSGTFERVDRRKRKKPRKQKDYTESDTQIIPKTQQPSGVYGKTPKVSEKTSSQKGFRHYGQKSEGKAIGGLKGLISLDEWSRGIESKPKPKLIKTRITRTEYHEPSK